MARPIFPPVNIRGADIRMVIGEVLACSRAGLAGPTESTNEHGSSLLWVPDDPRCCELWVAIDDDAPWVDVTVGTTPLEIGVYDQRHPEDRATYLNQLRTIAEAVIAGRVVIYSENNRRLRVETTVISSPGQPPLIHRSHTGQSGAEHTFSTFIPWP